MLKKFLTIVLLVSMFFNASGTEILAAEVGSFIAQKTDKEAPKTLLDSFGNKDRFKLFEPARYGFLSDENTQQFLPQNDEEEEEEEYFNYSRAYLENIITETEGAIELRGKTTEYIEILNPSLLLPIYGTTISMTGRKTFGLKYNAKKYNVKSTTNNRDVSEIAFEQEMQLKVQGKISNRIFVDIDYDDQRPDSQNIAIAYKGKEGELVQSVDFGDITLSLPATQFLSYSKQVFGAKMHLQHKDANLYLIGSQSKGDSKTKQFKGNSVFETVNIKDLSYIRRTYYSLDFQDSHLPSWDLNAAIVSGSLEVYLNDHTNTGYQVAMQAADYKTCTNYPGTGGDAPFRLLTEGVDYTVDIGKKMLIFNRQLNAADVVAVNFRNTAGQQAIDICNNGSTPIPYILLKTQDDRALQDATQEGSFNLEIKRYYNIGTTQLTRDNGTGNFILKLLESDGAEVCPETTTYDFCPSPEQVDYDKGIFYIRKEFTDRGLYNTTPVSSTNRYFFIQFNSTVKTYFLEPDIVVQSEKVKVNGATMARNKDYYIDYSSGYLTFYNRDLIGDNSIINVDYEVSNQAKDSMLLGGRLSYDFTKNISVGASILHDSNTKPKTVPQIGDLTTSLTTMEADARVKDLQVTDGLKITAGVEGAKSKKDNNLFGYAMIESMQQIKERVSASTVFSDWKIASNPTAGTSFFDSIKWDSQEIPVLEINPNAVANSNEKQNVLVINYDFSNLPAGYENRDEVSIVFPISNTGTDFSNKTLLELTMLGEENGPKFNISFGTMNEMSDNYTYVPPEFTDSEIYPTCSKYYVSGGTAVPKTEDLRCTGQLTINEDSGWVFVNPDNTYTRYNPFANNIYNPLPQPNGVIDTQDLNDNGILDSYDATSGGDFGFNGTALLETPDQQIDYTGWKTFQKIVDFGSTDALKNRWSSIQQMRITLKKGGKDKGTIKIANLTVSGSVWQPLDSDENILTTYGINNVDDPQTYKPIFNDSGDGGQVFRTLYGSVSNIREEGSNNIMEQSLAIKYNFPSTSTVTDSSVQKNFSPMDFSTHEEFHFLLYNKTPADNMKFYLRIATDDNNYSEIEVPLDSTSFPTNEWRLYKLKLIDLSGDHVPDRWENISAYPSTFINAGNLNYKRVGIIKAGVRKDGGTLQQGEIWLDDIFLAKGVVSEGEAYEADATIKYQDWFEVGGKVFYKDDLFQTPITVASKQKNKEENYFLKFKKIKYLPVEANYYRSNTNTPDVLNHDTTNTVSLLDKGEVDRKKGAVTARYQNPKLPQITVGYNFNSTDYDLIKRKDDTDNYTAALNYSSSKQTLIKNVNANIGFTNNKINYDNTRLQTLGPSIYNTDEKVKNYSVKLNLVPWQGSSLVPSYSLTTADESRKYYSSEINNFESKKYAKYAVENVGLSTSLRLRSWLVPTASYNVVIKENNNLSKLTLSGNSIDIGQVKSINRSSEGNLSLTLSGRDIFKNNKLLSTLSISNNYKLQDGDAWEYVDNDFNALDKIWLRSSMGINSPYARRTTMTLRNTYTNSFRWNPFKEYAFGGNLMPLNSVSIISNFSYASQENENLGSYYQTKNTTLPDVVFFIDNLEKFFDTTPRYISGTSLKIKYSDIKSETINTSLSDNQTFGTDLRFLLMNTFDTNLSYIQSTTDKDDLKNATPLSAYLRRDFTAQTTFTYKKMRITPKFTYILDSKKELTNQALALVTQVKEIVPAVTFKLDFNLPHGFALPFTSKQYLTTNRVIWTTNLSYSRRRAFTVDDNRDLLDINTNLDYELSKNIRFTLSAAFQKFKHLYIKENSYTAYNIGTLMTIQF